MNRRSTNIAAILILLVIIYGIWSHSRLSAREALSMPLEDANSLQIIGDALDAVHYKLDSKEDVESHTKCLFVQPNVLRRHMENRTALELPSFREPKQSESYGLFNATAGSDENAGIGELTGAGGGMTWLIRREAEVGGAIESRTPAVTAMEIGKGGSHSSELHASKVNKNHTWHDGTTTAAGSKPGTSGKALCIITYKSAAGDCDLLPAGFETATIEQVNKYVPSSVPFFKQTRVMVNKMPAHVNVRINPERHPTVVSRANSKEWKSYYKKPLAATQCSLGLSPSWHTSVWAVADRTAIDSLKQNSMGWTVEPGTIYSLS